MGKVGSKPPPPYWLLVVILVTSSICLRINPPMNPNDRYMVLSLLAIYDSSMQVTDWYVKPTVPALSNKYLDTGSDKIITLPNGLPVFGIQWTGAIGIGNIVPLITIHACILTSPCKYPPVKDYAIKELPKNCENEDPMTVQVMYRSANTYNKVHLFLITQFWYAG